MILLIIIYYVIFKESNYINDSKTINEVTPLKSVKKNTILYIPTGKTYITTLIIKEKGETLNKYIYKYYLIVLKYSKSFILKTNNKNNF